MYSIHLKIWLLYTVCILFSFNPIQADILLVIQALGASDTSYSQYLKNYSMYGNKIYKVSLYTKL